MTKNFIKTEKNTLPTNHLEENVYFLVTFKKIVDIQRKITEFQQAICLKRWSCLFLFFCHFAKSHLNIKYVIAIFPSPPNTHAHTDTHTQTNSLSEKDTLNQWDWKPDLSELSVKRGIIWRPHA